ncbi:dihydropteroate synthase, partial [Nocardiopsis tropica]|nr:dihydropteroate synthase [Nocardiopsis tropica]
MLRLRGREYGADTALVMAIVNRTPDSFYDKGATWDDGPAFERVRRVVDEGADI